MRSLFKFGAFGALAVLVSALAATALGGCSDDSTPAPAADTDGGVEASVDSGPVIATCATTRAFVIACKGDLNCGAEKFDAWCTSNDAIVNSEAFRRAEEKCLVAPANCEPNARRDCEYTHYGTETPTAAQSALATAYCAACEPADVAGCTSRSTTYTPGAGPASVNDIFIAAWELADPLCDAIREKCTGASFDAGADCAKAFGSCSGGVYLDKLPDCPRP